MKKQWLVIVVSILVIWVTAVSLSLTDNKTRAYQLTPTSANYLPVVLHQPTPTFTPTATPTAMPSPTPTPIPEGVFVLNNHSHYVDNIDYLHIVGEIQNNTSDHLRFVRISANIFSSGGQFLGTDSSYIFLGDLPAGEKTCFELALPEPANWSYYEFEGPTFWTDGQAWPNLAIFNDSGTYISLFGWYEIIGQVRNDHAVRVEYVGVVSTLYDGSDKVIGCDFTFVNSTHLDPAQTSSFEMTAIGRDYADLAAYRLQADGNPQLYQRWLSE